MTAPHPAAARADRRPVPRDTTAVVLTHLRPRLAGDVVRSLLDVEGLPPDRVIVVVNGEGGLDDPALEEQVRMVRLPAISARPAASGPGSRWRSPTPIPAGPTCARTTWG